jgi:hypothetical protein
MGSLARRMRRVGAKLERNVLTAKPSYLPLAQALAVSVDRGHVKSIRSYQIPSFDIIVAHTSNDQGQQMLFGIFPVQADRESGSS